MVNITHLKIFWNHGGINKEKEFKENWKKSLPGVPGGSRKLSTWLLMAKIFQNHNHISAISLE